MRGLQFDVVFDPKQLEVVDVNKGGGTYGGLPRPAGVAPRTFDDDLRDANVTGRLNLTFIVPGAGSVPPGNSRIASITLKEKSKSGAAATVRLASPVAVAFEESSVDVSVNLSDAHVAVQR